MAVCAFHLLPSILCYHEYKKTFRRFNPGRNDISDYLGGGYSQASRPQVLSSKDVAQARLLYFHLAALLREQLHCTAQIPGVLPLPHTRWLFQGSRSHLLYEHSLFSFCVKNKYSCTLPFIRHLKKKSLFSVTKSQQHLCLVNQSLFAE